MREHASVAPGLLARTYTSRFESQGAVDIAGSRPGATFTAPPLELPAGQFGLGHSGGAHAPNEYWVVEPANPKVALWMARRDRSSSSSTRLREVRD